MLRWAIIFAVVAVLACLLGFTGIAGAAAGVAKILFFLFLAVVAFFVIAGLFAGKKITGISPGAAAKLAAALREGKHWQRLLKRGVHTLDKPEYQLMYVDDGLAAGAELTELKVIQAQEWY